MCSIYENCDSHLTSHPLIKKHKLYKQHFANLATLYHTVCSSLKVVANNLKRMPCLNIWRVIWLSSKSHTSKLIRLNLNTFHVRYSSYKTYVSFCIMSKVPLLLYWLLFSSCFSNITKVIVSLTFVLIQLCQINI